MEFLMDLFATLVQPVGERIRRLRSKPRRVLLWIIVGVTAVGLLIAAALVLRDLRMGGMRAGG